MALPKTISEVLSLPWTPQLRDQIFIVRATVDGLSHRGGWFYATCTECGKKVETSNWSFWCEICCRVSHSSTIRFRIYLRVQDDSGETMFTLFNRDVEHLLHVSANKILRRLSIGSVEYPTEIMALAGRSFEFKIMMPDYSNGDDDFHNMRVIRLREISKVNRPVLLKKKELSPLTTTNPRTKRLRRLGDVLSAYAGPSNGAPCIQTECSACKSDESEEVTTPTQPL